MSLNDSFAASFQHIELVNERQAKLFAARIEAENQLLHRIGSAHRCGEITIEQLDELWDQYKALGLDGRSKRWDANIDVKWRAMQHRVREAVRLEMHAKLFAPNGPAGSWVGVWPRGINDRAPATGTAVVYVLFDATNEPCYVGSTKYFRSRLSQHAASGKEFTSWQAYPCRDREHAYQLEVQLLQQHKPRLNQKVGR